MSESSQRLPRENVMGQLVISQNVTLDGVAQDPTGEEGLRFGGWFAKLTPGDREAWAKVEYIEALNAEAILLGRRSDEYFATRWLTRTGEWADRLNSMPKYVVSTTIEKALWGNATVLTGDVVTEVSKLRQQLTGELVVMGSGQLVPTLMEHDLVDEVRLMIFPEVAGAGQRFFGETTASKPLRLVSAETVGASLTLLTYKVVRE
jgi:dihydrofolate reductase